MKYLFLVFALLGSAASAVITASFVLERDRPQLSLLLWPGNADAKGRIGAALGRNVIAQELQNQPVPEEQRKLALLMARESINASPLNPRSVRTLALSSDISDNERHRYLLVGNSQSKRDSLTQLWLVDLFARQGKNTEALEHMDVLLRRDTAYRDMAGQVLAKSLADPRALPMVADLLRDKAPWSSLLYYYLNSESANWTSYVALHRELKGTGIIPAASSEAFASTLIENGRFEDAAEISAIVGRSYTVGTSTLAQKEFDLSGGFPGTWKVADSASATLSPLSGGGALLDMSASASGEIARRLISLKPGSYDLSVISEDSTSVENRLGLKLICAGSAQGGDRTNGEVPSGCLFQWLILTAQASSGGPESVFIDRLEVRRAN